MLAGLSAPDLDRTRFWRLKRSGATTQAALVRLGYTPDLAQSVARDWPGQMESDEWLAADEALPGAIRALRRLRAAGYRLAVLTARRRPAGAQLSLRATGIADAIDGLHVVSPGEAVRAKAQALLDLSARCFIGDTDSDGAAAQLAAVPFAAVSTGQRSRSYLRAAGYEAAASLHAALAALGL